MKILLCFAFALVAPPAFVKVTSFKDAAIDESSGLAVSVLNPGIVWTHNDSGDTARGFAVDTKTGETKLVLNVKGATALDWEDMAIFRTSTGADLLFGDIGDNAEKREQHTIYRVTEPQLSDAKEIEVSPTEVIKYRYPDGPHNAEALLAHPKTGLIYVISKRNDGNSAVYRLNRGYSKSEVNTLEKVADFPVEDSFSLGRRVTGGAISPDGQHVAILTYAKVFELDVPAGDFEKVWTGPRRTLAVPALAQWEAITYLPDSKSIYLDSEGKGATIYQFSPRG